MSATEAHEHAPLIDTARETFITTATETGLLSEFERAWGDPHYTRAVQPEIDINLVRPSSARRSDRQGRTTGA